MSRKKNRRSEEVLTHKQPPVSAADSPWWSHVMREISARPGWLGSIRTIEEITSSLPRYPDGRRVMRGRVVARRLRPILELVSRGPNSSLGIGASYRILQAPMRRAPTLLATDEEWLVAAASKKIGTEIPKKGRRWTPPQMSGSLG